MVERAPDVLVDAQGLVGAPDETAGEEDDEEDDAVVELCVGTRHAQFIEEPVEVQERA